jgi:hypothetical protein
MLLITLRCNNINLEISKSSEQLSILVKRQKR